MWTGASWIAVEAPAEGASTRAEGETDARPRSAPQPKAKRQSAPQMMHAVLCISFAVQSLLCCFSSSAPRRQFRYAMAT